MALKIDGVGPDTPARPPVPAPVDLWVVDETYCLASDRVTVVRESDPRAAWLLCGAGTAITYAEKERWGLPLVVAVEEEATLPETAATPTDAPTPSDEETEMKATDPAEDKAVKPIEDKAVKPATNKAVQPPRRKRKSAAGSK